MTYNLIFILLLLILLISYKPNTKRDKLIKLLDGMDLNNKWLPGKNISCYSGETKPDKSTTVKSSHCSCFIAAVCKKMNISMIGPPNYSQYHLADKQLKWLETDNAFQESWFEIYGSSKQKYIEAQKIANEGKLVIVGVKQTKNTNGHIAIVRPCYKLQYFVINDGPQVITSSHVNSYSIAMKDDFMLHKKEFKFLESEIQFFYNNKNIDDIEL